MARFCDLTDEDLVHDAQQGIEEALTVLYERYLTVVYRRVRYTIPEADVEDVTQDIFIAMLRSLKGFRGDAQFKTWLRTLTNRAIADYYRHRDMADFQQTPGWQDEDSDNQFTVQGLANPVENDDQILVRQALGRLPTHYQEVILLRFAEDLPFLEIARQQRQSLEATKSLFRRAIAMLQKILEETYAG